MRRAKRFVLGVTLLFAAAGTMAVACRAPTQITVDVTAPDDVVCQARLQTAIAVGTTGSYEDRAASSTAVGCTSHKVGSLVVIPTGDETEDVAIRVVGSLDGSKCEAPAYGPSCIVARRALHFIPNTSLKVIVELGADCANVPCTATTTCVENRCVGATIGDPSQCANGDGCGAGALGAASDAGSDAPLVDSTVNDAPSGDANGADSGASESGGPVDAGHDALVGPLLAVGDDFACARRVDGTVSCWGQNASGELGFFPSPGNQETIPKVVPTLGNPIALSGGDQFGCELLQGGTVKCWGTSHYGALGLPPDSGVSPPITLTTGASALCAGSYESCVIDPNGGLVKCWAGSPSDDGFPINLISNAVQLACASQTACARIADGTVRCWGSSSSGDLGVPGVTQAHDAVTPAIDGVVDLAMFYHHACAALSDGGVKCWGVNDSHESDPSYDAGPDALADIPNVETPTLVAGVSGATHVAVGIYHSCALLADGGVTCWGSNEASQVGTSASCGTGCGPAPVTILPHAIGIAGGLNETCVTIDDGGVWCWGANNVGQLGRATATGDELPAPVHF